MLNSDTRWLNILEKIKPHPAAIVGLEDNFRYQSSDSVDPRLVLQDPDISLYALDPARGRVVFVKTKAGSEIFTAPFTYMAQYEQAERLLVMPFDVFHQLAAEVTLDDSRLILVYSTGRCGSTLVGHALMRGDAVGGYSEPDIYTQIQVLRAHDGSNDAEVTRLVESATKLLCAHAAAAQATSTFVLKFRNWTIHLGDIFYKLFPQAKLVFLYRSADGWARSVARSFGIFDPANADLITAINMLLCAVDPLYNSYAAAQGTPFNAVEMIACMWIATLERYFVLRQQGISMVCVRYDELKRTPREALQPILDHCQIQVADLSGLEAVLEKDAQAGTLISQENAAKSRHDMQLEHYEVLHDMIKRYSKHLVPDILLPN